MKNVDKARSANSCAHVSAIVIRGYGQLCELGPCTCPLANALHCNVPTLCPVYGLMQAHNVHTGKCFLVCCVKRGVHVPPGKALPCYGLKKARVKWKWQRKWK